MGNDVTITFEVGPDTLLLFFLLVVLVRTHGGLVDGDLVTKNDIIYRVFGLCVRLE